MLRLRPRHSLILSTGSNGARFTTKTARSSSVSATTPCCWQSLLSRIHHCIAQRGGVERLRRAPAGAHGRDFFQNGIFRLSVISPHPEFARAGTSTLSGLWRAAREWCRGWTTRPTPAPPSRGPNGRRLRKITTATLHGAGAAPRLTPSSEQQRIAGAPRTGAPALPPAQQARTAARGSSRGT